MKHLRLIFLLMVTAQFSCGNEHAVEKLIPASISEEAKAYWYSGTAEITSFKIQQARYGEIRDGYAVMIFVTEDFSSTEFTKADKTHKNTTPVLKHNFTRNFVTGIYPYSIMTSIFVPFENQGGALKISTSVQEWCGHVYMEMTRAKKMSLSVSSYFENENLTKKMLEPVLTEDELWCQLRLYPESIPSGTQTVLPSFSYLRLMHKEPKAYTCSLKKEVLDSIHSRLTLDYPELERHVEITYETAFPRYIKGWTESYPDGFGPSQNKLTSHGTKITTIRSDYWTKNKRADEPLRKELGLE